MCISEVDGTGLQLSWLTRTEDCTLDWVRVNIADFEKEMLKTFTTLPPRLATSASTGLGQGALLRYIASLRKFYQEESKEEHS